MNTGAIFPGFSYELYLSEKIHEINKLQGGRQTFDKDRVFIELRNESGNFRFRFSTNKNDYLKCSICTKMGLIDKIYYNFKD
jgi:hypothetical protein